METNENVGPMKLIFNYNNVFSAFSMMTSADAYTARASMRLIMCTRAR